MRKVAIGVAVIVPLIGTPGLAAPPAAPAGSAWAGCYAGLNIGGGWGPHTGQRGIINSGNGTLNAGIGVPAELDITPTGVIGGGQIGCNYQIGQIVLGAETDIQGSSIKGTTNIYFPSPDGGITEATTTTGSDRIDWFGTVRGRLGFVAWDNLLLYGTGGLAYGGVESSASLVLTPASDGNYAATASETKTGWTAGVGAEYAFTRNWSVKLEYLHLDLGTTNVRMLDPNRPGTFIDYGFHHRDDIVRAGFNYRFE